MKLHEDEQYGFGIEIPEDWSKSSGKLPPWLSLPLALKLGWSPSVNVQFIGTNESFNISIETMSPELPPDVTELLSIIYTQDMEYVNCDFGRITVQGKSHTWTRYELAEKLWSKKYLIVLGGNGYAITAACNDKKIFVQQETVWDAIVSSFYLLEPIDDSTIAFNQSTTAYRTIAKLRETLETRVERRARNLSYGKACDLIEEGRHSDARYWLEKCLEEFSEDNIETQVFILKNLVIVSNKMGDKKSVIRLQREIKRLIPSDYNNRIEIIELLREFGHRKEALKEVEYLIAIEPNRKRFQELKNNLVKNQRPNYRLRFIFSVAYFPIIWWNVMTEGIILKAPWLAAILCLFAAYHLNLSGQWIGLTRKVTYTITVGLHCSTIIILTLFGDLNYIWSIFFFLPMVIPTLKDSNPKD